MQETDFEGKGTTRQEMPEGMRGGAAHRGKEPGQAPNAVATAAPQRLRKRVLVVDDDREIADSAKQVLERFIPGVQVEVATSARAGLDVLQDHPVDLAVVDYRMPDRDGLEFVRRAHGLEPGLPVILMTAFGSVDMAAKAINEHQVAGFLTKPFDAVVLADTVRRALDRNEPATAAA